jgi:lysine 2,3-aminomutase
VGDSSKINMKDLEAAFNYLEQHTEINDVILSGGDPLMLTDAMLEKVLARLREIKHITIIRLGTKMPCVLPQRITPQLCDMLKKYHPIYVNTHFNHPWEYRKAPKPALMQRRSDADSASKGVNDDQKMKELMKASWHK